LKSLVATALAGLLCLAPLRHASAAEDVTGITVLSPEDVKTYGAIFTAQKSGQFARADRLIKQLNDTSLLGYVLQDRYLGAHYKSKFDELKSWLSEYGDLVGADAVYKLAAKRAPKRTSVPAPERAHWRGSSGEGQPFEDMALDSGLARQVAAQLRGFEREGRPDAADALYRKFASSKSGLSQADIDRLGAYVATAYLAEMRDKEALKVANEIIARGRCEQHTVPMDGGSCLVPAWAVRGRRQPLRSGCPRLQRAAHLCRRRLLGSAQLDQKRQARTRRHAL
jgi:hypothetical protein